MQPKQQHPRKGEERAVARGISEEVKSTNSETRLLDREAAPLLRDVVSG